MMILASFARTFKDGQAMIQPVYFLVFLPFLLGQGTDMFLRLFIEICDGDIRALPADRFGTAIGDGLVIRDADNQRPFSGHEAHMDSP